MKEFYTKHKQAIIFVALVVAIVIIWKYRDQLKAKVMPKSADKPKIAPTNGGGQEIVTVSPDVSSTDENSDWQVAVVEEAPKETVYVSY